MKPALRFVHLITLYQLQMFITVKLYMQLVLVVCLEDWEGGVLSYFNSYSVICLQ